MTVSSPPCRDEFLEASAFGIVGKLRGQALVPNLDRAFAAGRASCNRGGVLQEHSVLQLLEGVSPRGVESAIRYLWIALGGHVTTPAAAG